ncbi:hypothetical protein C3B79_2268 [Aeromonas hydrophila]|nr:hypothetical protein C3B79_2268 [Aeromonas hydrophila]
MLCSEQHRYQRLILHSVLFNGYAPWLEKSRGKYPYKCFKILINA